MSRRDEDALSWDGDDDPTLDTGTPASSDVTVSDPTSLPAGWTPVGRGSVTHSTPERSGADTSAPEASAPEAAEVGGADSDNPEPAGLGTAALVSIGVLGGVYLLFAIGWLVGGLRLQGRYQVLVTDSMYQGALWLATAAPLIWFATTLFATRRSRGWVRWLWLALGVLLLIPWPFLMIGAVGR